MKAITSSEQIVKAAIELSKKKRKRIAVAAADDLAVLEAVSNAESLGICDATLYGSRERIARIADDHGVDVGTLAVENFATPAEAAYNAAKAASEGRADVIMKGFIATSQLLKTVLSREFNLRGKNTMSHTAVLDIPGYHKLIGMTDGGMVVKPDFEAKIQIIENGLEVFKALGYETPNVALSGAIDYVHENFPSTLLNQRVMDHYNAGLLKGCNVFGPLTFEAATNRETALQRGIENPVAGNADLFVVDTIEECNIVSKVLILFIKAVFAGVIIGASVPISLVSRTDSVENKKASLSTACLVAEHLSRKGGE